MKLLAILAIGGLIIFAAIMLIYKPIYTANLKKSKEINNNL